MIVDLSHIAADSGIDGGLRTADSDEHNYSVPTIIQRRCACHTRTVLHADAYGRQRCNVVLSACSVVYLPVVYVLSCVIEREGNKNRQNFTGTYVQNRPHTEKPGKSCCPLPSEQTFRTRHASYSARIELKPRPQVPDCLPVSTYLAF